MFNKIFVLTFLHLFCVPIKSKNNTVYTKFNLEQIVKNRYLTVVTVFEQLEIVNIKINADVNKCYQSIRQLIEDAKTEKSYALQVFDSVDVPNGGIFQGQFVYFGRYKQCIAVSEPHFKGQFCLLNIHAPNNFYKFLSNKTNTNIKKFSNLKIKFGVCLPTVCSNEEIQILGKQFSQMFQPPLSIQAFQCIQNENNKFEPISVLLFSFFLVSITIIIFIGTIKFHFKTDEPDMMSLPIFKQIILSFALQTNLKSIFTVPKSKNDSIQVFHGIKFFAMCSIISFHSFALSSFNIDFNNPLEMWHDFLSPVFANGAISVDSFFFISGYLVAFIMLKQFRKQSNVRINWLNHIVKRYIRMTPTMMALVAFGALIMRYMGNGPEWLGATVFYDLYCKRNWWINLLYLQNFVHQNETCLTHTWYSAVDTQLYLLSPVFIILLYKMPKTAFALCFAIIAASIVGTWTLTVMNNYPAVSYFTDSITTQQLVGYYNSIYTKPYFRVGPYLVGILAAYAMLENSFKNFNLKTWYLVTGWILSLTTMAAIILALYPTHQGNILEIHLAATYSAIARILWACCLAWITFASQQQKNIINAFLSLKIWVPFSKLTYCVYLVHPVIIAFFYGSQTKPFDYSFLLMFYFTVSHVVISYLISIVLAVTIEFPLVSVGNVILNKLIK